MKVAPIIIAGGFGRRLFPISTKEKPKQFIYFFKKNSCFQLTVKRIRTIFITEKIIICCNKNHVKIIEQQLEEINENNYFLLIEQEARNTFTSVLFCLKFAQKIMRTNTLFISPADSFIENKKAYAKNILNATMYSFTTNKHVIFGIEPIEANDKYGYIKLAKERDKSINNNNFYKIEHFKEKPSINAARKFIKSGNYLWNSGHFVLDVNVLFEDIKRYQKSAFFDFEHMKIANKNEKFYINDSCFFNLPILSFDEVIVEKSHNFMCCKALFDWCDIGSFETLKTLLMANKISIPKEYYLPTKRDKCDNNFLKLISNL